METAEIRRRWLRFFEERGHVVVVDLKTGRSVPTKVAV